MVDMPNTYRGVGGDPYNPANTPNAVISVAVFFARHVAHSNNCYWIGGR